MLRKFLHQCKRVLQVARKPGGDEYLTIAKITGIGILIIGTVGFVIRLVAELLREV
ncbi:MAG: protein translocase SEC61 complex subunit gamma [Candidatus Hadarchaeota archaeon]|nr:protein translocase SEC61 complex subunit gamma [Candidatus Hadarchaeota archaeon]